MSRRILFLTHLSNDGRSGQNVATASIIRAFVKAPNTVLALVCPQSRQRRAGENGKSPERNFRLPSREMPTVLWHLVVQPFLVFQLIRAIRVHRPDYVVARIVPTLFVATWICRLSGIPVYMLARGLSDELIAFGGWRGRVIHCIVALFSKLNLRAASGCVATTSFVRDTIIRKYGLHPELVRIFSNAADPVRFRPMGKDQARSKLGLPFGRSDLVVGFVGSMRLKHGILELVDAVKSLRSEGHSSLKILIVGDGPLGRVIQEYPCSDEYVFLQGWTSHEEIPLWIACCDIAYGPIHPDAKTNPIKCYEYLACARPVITSEAREFEFINAERAGFLMADLTSAEVRIALVKVFDMQPEDLEAMGSRGREYVARHHSWNGLVDLVEEMYSDRICKGVVPTSGEKRKN